MQANAGLRPNEDPSPISYCRRQRRSTHKRHSAPSRRPSYTAVATFELRISNTTYNIQSHTMPTHFIISIHLGPCLDQHPACGLVAIPGSVMERGVARLRGEGQDNALRKERGVANATAKVGKQSDRGNNGQGMDALRYCHGKGTAHVNRFHGLANPASRRVVL